MKKRILSLILILLSYPIFAQEAYQGYTLFNPQNSKTVRLIAMNGSLFHSWSCSANPALTVYLLKDSTIMRPQMVGSGLNGAGAGGQIQKISWNGTVLWSFNYSSSTYRQHHDICPMPNGNVLLISWDYRTASEAVAAGCLVSKNIYSEKIIEVEPTGATTGNIVWEWYLWDHLIQNTSSSKPNYGVISEHPERMNINAGNPGSDWIHANALDYNPQLDQVVFSSHCMSEIYVIDHSTSTAEAASSSGGNSGKGGDFLYRWGNPQIYGRGSTSDRVFYIVHGVNFVDSGLPGEGHIIAFNNQTTSTSKMSAVVEIIPPQVGYNYYIASDSAFGPTSSLWSYSASGFYSTHLGGVQRLPNGNTLACEATDNGKLWEITPSGTIAWSYTIGGEATRAYRYGLDYLVGVNEEKPVVSVKPEIEQIFPNPFNNKAIIKYNLPATALTSINLYDIAGKLVQTLVNETKNAGNYTLNLDAKKLSSGVYFLKLTAGEYKEVKKLTLTK